MTEAIDLIEHGTNTGYLKHYALGIPACDACREGHRAYMAEYRANNPDYKAKVNRQALARQRAHKRLSMTYPEEYQRLLGEELAKLDG